jgi:prevent-host-death family protein
VAKTVSVSELKAQLSSLVNAVAFGGERIIIQSRGRSKAALVSVEDLQRMVDTHPSRPSKAHRTLALIHVDRVRKTLKGLKLTDSVEELSRLREGRLRGLS